MAAPHNVSAVRSFWNTEACGTHFVKEFRDDADFYARFREQRYRTEWHIPLLVPFTSTAGKEVLEIGTGNGADGVMFAQHGAHYTGVDLTQTAIDATRKHFDVLGLKGRFQVENAERLSFPDASFDLVYSHGVLHHTPHPQTAFDEVWRVLKPGGQAILMLYHKGGFNYRVRIMTYMRLRVLARILTRVGRWRSDRTRLSDELIGVRGNQDRKVWDIHYQNFLREGWSYLRAENFIHHCTDGPECPVAFAYNSREIQQMFRKFRNVTTQITHLPLRRYWSGVPMSLERFVAFRWGWYLFVFAEK